MYSNLKEFNPNTSPEANFLISCTKRNLDLEKSNSTLQINMNWEYLFNLAYKNRMIPLLYFNLINNKDTNIPEQYLNLMKEYCEKSSKQNLFLSQELLKIINLLRINNIDALYIKGPIMTSNIYQNLALREFGDLDILIHQNDFSKIKKIFLSHGYQIEHNLNSWQENLYVKNHYQITFQNKIGVNLDIHWCLTPKYLNQSFSWDKLLKNTIEIDFYNEKVKTLSTEYLLIYLCVHGSKDLWKELRALTDIYELINSTQNLNWGIILKTAKEFKVLKMVYLGILLTNLIYGAKIPNKIMHEIQSKNDLIKIAPNIYSNFFTLAEHNISISKQLLFHTKLLDTFIDKIRYSIYLGILPTINDWKCVSLPKHLNTLYYFIRPFRLFKKYSAKFISSKYDLVNPHKNEQKELQLKN